MEPGVTGGNTNPIHENVPKESGEPEGMINPLREPVPMGSGEPGGTITQEQVPVPMELGASGRKSLTRSVTRIEYETVVESFHSLGFTCGWLQEYESQQTYRPDFSRDHPFESTDHPKW
ncbi:hypothetical protein EG830_15135 [bacterium]|nr:hypothetical protein [bacterium]